MTYADKRFLSVNDDPRFKRQKKKASRVKIDARFKGMFEDDQFVSQTTTIDKYGRRVADTKKEKNKKRGGKKESVEAERLRQYYDLSDTDNSSQCSAGSASDDDNISEVSESDSTHTTTTTTSSTHSNNLDQSEEYLMDKVMAEHPLVNQNVGMGDATRRLALVNMDWDNVKALDIFTFCSAFKPPTGTILSVNVFPSDFGKERIAREAISGPVIDDDFGGDGGSDGSGESFGNDTRDYDEFKLRKYQLERLRYYYAVIECDRVETATAIYANCDGREFEQSGNIVDLRYIPDDVDFGHEEPTDTARPTDAPSKRYLAKTDLSTAALQTSSVKLTWDQDDPERQRLTRQAVQAGLSKRERSKLDVRDVDLAAYLASASDDSDDGDNNDDNNIEEYRQKLLTGNTDSDVFGRQSKRTGVREKDLSVVFGGAFDDASRDADSRGDTVVDNANSSDVDAEYTFTHDGSATGGDNNSDTSDDLTVFQRNQLKRKQKLKERRARRRAEHETIHASAKAATAAELSALMRHSSHSMRPSSRADMQKKMKADVDVTDDRFGAIYDQPDYAIDPSAPSFKRTAGMQALLEERARRRR